MKRHFQVALLLAGALGMSLATAPKPALADGDMTWPDGAKLRWGKDWYWPDGTHLLWGKDLYYPNGEHLRWGKDLYYPNGEHLRWGKDLYSPDGTARGRGDVGVLAELTDPGTGTWVRVSRERHGVTRVLVVVEGPGYRFEYVDRGKSYAARLWVRGVPHLLAGEARTLDALAPVATDPGPGHIMTRPLPGPPLAKRPPAGMASPRYRPPPPPPPPPPGYAFDPATPPRGKGPAEICGYAFDTLRWERADFVFLLHTRDGALWKVDARACHGGRVEEGVKTFAMRGDQVIYLDSARRAWVLVGDDLFHVATGATGVKANVAGLSFSVPKRGWYLLGAPVYGDGALRVHEEPLGRDVWFSPARAFLPSF